MSANDDGSTGLVPIGFGIDYFGLSFTDLYVNNNGNVTLDSPLSTYTPFDLTSTGRRILAPFFADVDTRGVGSGVVTYGMDTVGGRPAFGVNWIDVGYYSAAVDKLNSFQLVIIDRSDVNPGDFDFEFNYDRIEWETGNASGGSGGLGGDSARAGYSNGTGDPGTFFELPGSAVNGAFLDTNPTTGLALNSNVGVPGRFLFQVRNGVVEVCGDGILDPDEDCDDNNTVDGDCCSASCLFETGACDDGDACTDTDVCDGAGTCVSGGPVDCDDGDPCTTDSCDSGLGCVSEAPICRSALKSILVINDRESADKDKLIWKWIKGEATSQAELANPLTTAQYNLCLYAGSTTALIGSASVPPDANKWKQLSSKGFKYKDQAGTEDGIRRIVLKGGDQDKAKAILKGKGTGLPDLAPPLALPVTVKLLDEQTGVCLQGTYDIDDIKKNQPGKFKAKFRN